MKKISRAITKSNTLKRTAALTLVEVVMSVSIFSIAIIPIMGLLAHGVKNNKLSVEESSIASIIEIATSNLKMGNQDTLYFDFNGWLTTPLASVFKAESLLINRDSKDVGYGLSSTEVYRIKITHIPSSKITESAGIAFVLSARDPVKM